MERMFYNLHNGVGDVIDEEGTVTVDLTEAHAKSVDSIRSIIAEECLRGVIDLTGRIEVVGSDGKHLLTVTYDEAFELRLRESA